MHSEDHVRDLLIMEFVGAQAKNPNYSMRAYSRKVGIPQSAISEIIGKRRKVTAKMALKILKGLSVPPDKIAKLINSYDLKNASDAIPASNSSNFQSLTMDQFHVISEWFHFAILSLLETKEFKSDSTWISKRLGISKTQAEIAISRLLRLEMVALESKTKKLKATGIQYRIDPGVATAALKKACRENLQLATDALESTHFEERDFTAITLCIDPARLPEAKRMLKSFRGKFSQQMESGQKKEVYKLSLQLFPLTKNGVTK